jgi:hypothetical protein
MPKAGDNTIGAFGTLQGNYTPQLRMYYEVEGKGILCDVFDLKFLGRTRDRKEALRRGKEWMKIDGASAAAEGAWDILHNWHVMGYSNTNGDVINAIQARLSSVK